MFSTLRTRFGIPGVISVIALVFALVGGAYAANNSSSGGKATASAKAKKGPRGPKGATGPAGPAGAQGPAGPAGAKGDTGANGSNGSNGATGPTGPTGAAGVKGATGAAGATGATGATGFSGFTETLPAGKTETGLWANTEYGIANGQSVVIPISFPIPLSQTSEKAFYLNQEETTNQEGPGVEAGCTGTAEAPTAPEGTLCVYTAFEGAASLSFFFFHYNQVFGGYHTTGAVMEFVSVSQNDNQVFESQGSWAVTAAPAS